MTPCYEENGVIIYHGDNREIMRQMEPDSIDSVVSDPPYGMSFMGKGWDHAVPGLDYWAEVYRVLKPGGHLLAFGGTRLFHRLTCAIEDSGFEIRDCLSWVYGSGFPKSLDVSNAIEAEKWQGWGTALKPAWEPIIMARKPFNGTVANNVLEYGTGAINIDGCRISLQETGEDPRLGGKGSWHSTKPRVEHSFVMPPLTIYNHSAGRWPANLVHDGSDEVLAGFPETSSGAKKEGVRKSGIWNKAKGDGGPEISANSGSAARFFYCAKASKEDRGEGNNHPTVKPVKLMQWLCRMVTPKGGLLLDPFAGSFSTIVAARKEGFRSIGIDLEEEYCKIGISRLKQGVLDLF